MHFKVCQCPSTTKKFPLTILKLSILPLRVKRPVISVQYVVPSQNSLLYLTNNLHDSPVFLIIPLSLYKHCVIPLFFSFCRNDICYSKNTILQRPSSTFLDSPLSFLHKGRYVVFKTNKGIFHVTLKMGHILLRFPLSTMGTSLESP